MVSCLQRTEVKTEPRSVHYGFLNRMYELHHVCANANQKPSTEFSYGSPLDYKNAAD